MTDSVNPPASPEAKFQAGFGNLSDALPRQIKRSNSFTTATTSATEESSCCADSQNGTCSKPKKDTSPVTPGRQTKYLMTLTKTNNKNPNMKIAAMPTLAVDDESTSNSKPTSLNDSFGSNDDNEWWNQDSPQGSPVHGIKKKPKPKALSDVLPEERRAKTEGSVSTSGSADQKKKKRTKVKRISVTKVKAGDIGNMTTGKFRKKDGTPLSEEEMQEALKAWKTEQMKVRPSMSTDDASKDRRPKSASRRRSIDSNIPHDDASKSNRSKSTSRSRHNDGDDPSSIPSDIRRRSKSTSRHRSTDGGISMVPAGVSAADPRRAKSASRRRAEEGGRERPRNSRGEERGESDRHRRSRSVARRGTDDDGKRESAPRPRSKSLSQKKKTADTEGGRDRRSQSRSRPSASRDGGDKTRRAKSVSRKHSDARAERRVESERPGRSPESSADRRSRSKSLVGRAHSFDGDDDDRRKLKRATNIKDRRSNSRHRGRGLSFSREEDEFQVFANNSCGENFFSSFASEEFGQDEPKKTEASKNIPWQDFLLHSATSTR